MNQHYPQRSGWQGYLTQFPKDLQPSQVINSLITGLVIGVLTAITAVSFATLIFSSDLAELRTFGIGFILMGDLVLAALVALLSSYSGSIAIDQDAPAAIMALVVAGILGSMPALSTPEQGFYTVVAMVITTTFVTSLLFLALGYFKLGGLVRFLPYPVMGGFLAGTGWLLVTGAIGVMVDSPFNLNLLQASEVMRWFPGLIFGVLLLLILNRYSHFLILPGMFFGVIGLFYLVLWSTKTPIALISAQGWLLGPFPEGGIWHFPLTISNFSQVNWSVIFGNAGTAAPVLLVAMIAFLLNASGIELIVKQDIDLNKELVVVGVGNLFSGFVGGIVGFHAISLSSLNYKLSNSSRLTGVVTAIICGVTVFFGAVILSYIPKFVLGGILIFLGLSFLVEWIFQAWYKLPKVEFLVTIIIVAVIAIRGFLEGVALGILVTVILFVINYSRINVVKYMLDGSNFHSRVTRGRRHRQVLAEKGEQISILQLHGFIFFGTANSLLEQVRDRVRQPDLTPVHYVVLDFRQVTGLDSTALRSFVKLAQLAQEENITLLLTDLSPKIQEQFSNEELFHESAPLKIFSDLDHGVEWCENEVLKDADISEEGWTLQVQLEEILPSPEQIANLMKYLDLKDVDAGDYLIHQGDPPDYVYLVESGQVTAQLEIPDQDPIRLETMRGGRVVGELGFYLGTKRTASVVADEPSRIYILSKSDLQKMEQIDPEAASTFHRIIIQLLSERVVHLINTVNAIQR